MQHYNQANKSKIRSSLIIVINKVVHGSVTTATACGHVSPHVLRLAYLPQVYVLQIYLCKSNNNSISSSSYKLK